MKYFLIFLVFASLVLIAMPTLAVDQKGFDNPLGSQNLTVAGILTRIIQYLLGLVGIVSLLALITGGIRIILGFADENQVKTGKQVILWAILGLIVTILSWTIIRIVLRDILDVQF